MIGIIFYYEVLKSMSSKRILEKGKFAIKFGVWSVIIGIAALVIEIFTTSSDSQDLLILAGIILITAGIPIVIFGFIVSRSHNLSKIEYDKWYSRTFFGILLFNVAIFAVLFYLSNSLKFSLPVSFISLLIMFFMFVAIFPATDDIWCKFCNEKDYEKEEISQTLIRRYEKREKQEYTDGGHKRVRYIPLIIEDYKICLGLDTSPSPRDISGSRMPS
ncbi:MAG: hypothetical protein K2N67_04825, partial [Mucispirillum sp.]|nr:hypothetical protein [Mucispirillum sp.]